MKEKYECYGCAKLMDKEDIYLKVINSTIDTDHFCDKCGKEMETRK